MILIGTKDAAEQNPQRFELENGFSFKNIFFQCPPEERPSPNAYLIKQSPHSVVPTHFHHANQFQVIVGGSGRIGGHEVRPLMVHHAGQQTGYGPLVAGPKGLWYLTLRAVTETGAWFLPESRNLVNREIPKSQVTTPVVELSPPAELQSRSDIATEILIAPKPSGPACWLLRLPPRAVAAAPLHPNTVGRYYVVVAGTMLVAAQELPNLSTTWVSGEETFSIDSGSGGAEVLVLQFPADAWKYETRPAAPAAWASAS